VQISSTLNSVDVRLKGLGIVTPLNITMQASYKVAECDYTAISLH